MYTLPVCQKCSASIFPVISSLASDGHPIQKQVHVQRRIRYLSSLPLTYKVAMVSNRLMWLSIVTQCSHYFVRKRIAKPLLDSNFHSNIHLALPSEKTEDSFLHAKVRPRRPHADCTDQLGQMTSWQREVAFACISLVVPRWCQTHGPQR